MQLLRGRLVQARSVFASYGSSQRLEEQGCAGILDSWANFGSSSLWISEGSWQKCLF